jgi:hypothetical protein
MQLPLIPNQALYQAEPQPELIRLLPDGFLSAALYFAYFRAHGKRFRIMHLTNVAGLRIKYGIDRNIVPDKNRPSRTISGQYGSAGG